MRRTHTYVELPLTQAAFDEIEGKLRAAGYEHAISDGTIDMHGLAIVVDDEARFEALLGSDWQPSHITLCENSTVQLGEVVCFAFKRCGMTTHQWNTLPCRVREVLLIEAITTMKEEAYS